MSNLQVGIGFATGRKSFQRVLRTYVYNWKESGLIDNSKVGLNLFVAYDLAYHRTKVSDYTKMHSDISGQIDTCTFIGNAKIKQEIADLIDLGVLNAKQAHLLFGKGYAGKRNSVVYHAIKSRMDCLLFLDDDEYPIAVTKTRDACIWSGQHVLISHVRNVLKADITHGHHCGYISPIPFMEFDDVMSEQDFRTFVEAISNDIVKWDTLKTVMKNGGVTYADTRVLTENQSVPVDEINHAKFISGANLCLNLRDPKRVFPFYNPPGARGEDTFLSTCLGERTVLKVPVYTFHDGFSTYNHLLDGVLPIHLNFIKADSAAIVNRFYRACVGWVRYKPLLLYITQREQYEEKIESMREKLAHTLPKLCAYFHEPAFSSIANELEKFHRNANKHYEEFVQAQDAWAKIMDHLAQERA